MTNKKLFLTGRKEEEMRRFGISDVLVLLICGVSVLCFISCSTTAGGVEAGVHIGEEPVVHGGHSPHGGPPPHAPAHGYRAKHKYHYYPDSSVYFDVDRGMYFYLAGDKWQVSASLPSSIQVDLGDHVSIDLDTSQPYEYHEEHKHKYPPGKGKKKEKNKGKGKW
jgi:hypothetical protein